MAPTEESILSNFLLLPAPLPTFITLQKFAELFPRAQRSNPQIRLLYRELQHLRDLHTDDVEQNVVQEAKRGERQQREVLRVRRKAEKHGLEGMDGREVEMEMELCGPTSNLPQTNPHTLTSILTEMTQACTDIEAEIDAMYAEAQAIFHDIEGTIGDLSDLRYGRFNKPAGTGHTTGEQVLQDLQRLEEVCRGRLLR